MFAGCLTPSRTIYWSFAESMHVCRASSGAPFRPIGFVRGSPNRHPRQNAGVSLCFLRTAPRRQAHTPEVMGEAPTPMGAAMLICLENPLPSNKRHAQFHLFCLGSPVPTVREAQAGPARARSWADMDCCCSQPSANVRRLDCTPEMICPTPGKVQKLGK